MAVQVADRLISLQYPSGAVVDFNPDSTKVIVLEAQDAIVSIAYAGQAYVGNLSTDEWLVELITGAPSPRHPGDASGIRLGPTANNWKIGYILNRIANALPASILPKQLVQISVTGFQWNKRGICRHILYELYIDSKGVSKNNRSPRHWAAGVAGIANIGIALPASTLEAVCRRIIDANPPMEYGKIASTLAEEMSRYVGGTIGPDFNCVVIPAPGRGNIVTSFAPRSPHHLSVGISGLNMSMKIGYSPWIVGPATVAPPHVMVGGLQFGLGKFLVEAHAPPGEKGVFSIAQMQPQKRR